MQPIIKVDRLIKNFGKNEILKGVSFEVNKGDVISVIGSSGSGKSTMLRCINLLEEKSGGEIYFNGRSVTSLNRSEYRAKVGMVFQQFNLFNNMTVLQNCVVGQREVLKRNKAEAKEKRCTGALT